MRTLNVAYMGGRQAGCVGLLTLYAARCNPTAVVAYDELIFQLAKSLELPVFASILDANFEQALLESDLLISVHGREIVPKRLLDIPKLGGINAHPCLYSYKGSNPVGRLLQDKNPRASVGVHYMSDKVDEGEVLVEEFVQVEGLESEEEIYNSLYPFYVQALLKALKIVQARDHN